ncbi:MAG: hypothetical protein AB2556_24475, partial [Candidatus Thiodiazotropha sp.]
MGVLSAALDDGEISAREFLTVMEVFRGHEAAQVAKKGSVHSGANSTPSSSALENPIGRKLGVRWHNKEFLPQPTIPWSRLLLCNRST